MFRCLLFLLVASSAASQETDPLKSAQLILSALQDNHDLTPENIFRALVEDAWKPVYLNGTQIPTEEKVRDIWDCAIAAKQVLGGLKSLQMWAMKMIDAGTKIPSGLLLGNIIDFGEYDECIGISKQDTNHTFSGKHCLVSISITGLTKIKVSDNVTIGDLLGGKDLALTSGHCFPSVCKPYVLVEGFKTVLWPINLMINSTGIALIPSIDVSDCHTADNIPLRTEEWVFMIFVLFILFVTAIGTTIDISLGLAKKASSTRLGPAEQCVLAFSAINNGKKLLSLKKTPGQMSFINGMKFLSIAWVVLGHRYRYLITEPIINVLDLPQEIAKWSKMFLLSAPLSVDTFFFMGGLLNMYSFSAAREKKVRYTGLVLVFSYIHRYLRVTPAYMFMIGFTATWLYRLGDGPYWNRLVLPETRACQDNFGWNLLYVNNYYPSNYCMMQSWYLAADMQMYWLSPLVMYPLWRWPIGGIALLIVLTALSIISPFLVSYFYAIKAPMPMTTDPVAAHDIMTLYYLPTHVKTVSYVIGLGTGALLHYFKTGKIRFRMNIWVNLLLWLVSGVLMFYALLGGYYLYQIDHPYNKWESAFYIGFFRFLWALGLMWITLVCAMGHGGPINSFLSWRVFGPLGRLTYCIYLTHISVILYGIGSLRLTIYFRDYDQVHEFFGDLAITVVVAAVLSILCESPLMTLEKLIFRGRRPRPSAPKREDTESGPSEPVRTL